MHIYTIAFHHDIYLSLAQSDNILQASSYTDEKQYNLYNYHHLYFKTNVPITSKPSSHPISKL